MIEYIDFGIQKLTFKDFLQLQQISREIEWDLWDLFDPNGEGATAGGGGMG